MQDTAMPTEPLLHLYLLTASQPRLLSSVITQRRNLTHALKHQSHCARQDKTPTAVTDLYVTRDIIAACAPPEPYVDIQR